MTNLEQPSHGHIEIVADPVEKRACASCKGTVKDLNMGDLCERCWFAEYLPGWGKTRKRRAS